MKRMELRWISMLLVAIMLLTGLPAGLAEAYDILLTQADDTGVELNGMDLDDQLELGGDAIIDPDGVLAEGLELDSTYSTGLWRRQSRRGKRRRR